LSPSFEQTLTVNALRDKIDDAESALRPGRRSTSDSIAATSRREAALLKRDH
jgi:hypothetical protein